LAPPANSDTIMVKIENVGVKTVYIPYFIPPRPPNTFLPVHYVTVLSDTMFKSKNVVTPREIVELEEEGGADTVMRLGIDMSLWETDKSLLGGIVSARFNKSGLLLSAGWAGKNGGNHAIYAGIGRAVRGLRLEAGAAFSRIVSSETKWKLNGLVRIAKAFRPWRSPDLIFLPGLTYSPGTGVGLSIGLSFR
jgi:hypothetical protein